MFNDDQSLQQVHNVNIIFLNDTNLVLHRL